MRKWILLAFLAWPAAAPAAVDISFHSKEMGSSFPHALVVLKGTLDETGEAVDESYGFTVRHQIGPSVLMGPVQGKVASHSADYVASTNRHFTLTLTDEEYRTVTALVERWRALPQPSYQLNSRNCVFFVADVAAAIGLQADPDKKLMKKPRSFLEKVKRQNESLIAARSATGAKPAATEASATAQR